MHVTVKLLFWMCCFLAACDGANLGHMVKNTPRRRVVLFGPHDRFNFGDLLFEKVLLNLLDRVLGYTESDILSAGMISTDMSIHGGAKQIVSMKEVVEMSRREAISNGKGPYDLILTGGESGHCSVECGATMMSTPELAAQARNNMKDFGDCAYNIDKRYLLPKSWTNFTGVIPKPVAIKNSIGGGVAKFCNFPVDYASYRDGSGIITTPDSAVMVRLLYSDVISHYGSTGEVMALRNAVPGTRYMVVQANMHPENLWAESLDEISRRHNLTTVFFRAGTAPGHDTLERYQKIAALMTTPYVIFEQEHVWKIVALISHAELVISTSLHVRIMAFVFHKPRAILKSESKHRAFLKLWEAYPFNVTCNKPDQELVNYVSSVFDASMDSTVTAAGRAIELYIKGFSTWSKLLNK
jgi:hypothetical protein